MVNVKTNPHIAIGISSCLLGNNVRYDGKHKQHEGVFELAKHFQCIALCPEVAIGLGVPRKPVHLVRHKNGIQAVGLEQPELNITTDLQHYADSVIEQYTYLCGYVFKARSPSCGLGTAPLSGAVADHQQEEFTSGLYAARLRQGWPDLPMVEESDLDDQAGLDNFISRVIGYYQIFSR